MKWKAKTKKELLKEALAYVEKYLKKKDANLTLVATYLVSLSKWIKKDEGVTTLDDGDSGSNPPTPPPPPPGLEHG